MAWKPVRTIAGTCAICAGPRKDTELWVCPKCWSELPTRDRKNIAHHHRNRLTKALGPILERAINTAIEKRGLTTPAATEMNVLIVDAGPQAHVEAGL